MISRDLEPKLAEPPARCPHCGGREITTTSKVIDPTTYWRCLTCGEVWNVDRHHIGRRFGFRR